MKGNNVIVELSFDFSINIIKLYLKLIDKREYVLSKQLLRSATSIGANIEEAGAALTKKDFINKMSIASKEARESKYWLCLLEKSRFVDLDFTDYIQQVQSIINILTKIIKTAQQNLNTQ
jgi:four helix bundle protein